MSDAEDPGCDGTHVCTAAAQGLLRPIDMRPSPFRLSSPQATPLHATHVHADSTVEGEVAKEVDRLLNRVKSSRQPGCVAPAPPQGASSGGCSDQGQFHFFGSNDDLDAEDMEIVMQVSQAARCALIGSPSLPCPPHPPCMQAGVCRSCELMVHSMHATCMQQSLCKRACAYATSPPAQSILIHTLYSLLLPLLLPRK